MTIKSYTSIAQSQVLAKFLSLESADMRYGHIAPNNYSDRMHEAGYEWDALSRTLLIKLKKMK